MVLDDEPTLRRALQIRMERAGYNVLVAGSYNEFTEKMIDCAVVLCDIFMPGDNGLQALDWTRNHYPDTIVIMMTGNPSYETATEAIRLGAYDYLTKPITGDELLLAVDRAIQHRQLKLDKKRLESENEAYRHSLEKQVAQQTQALRESQQFLTNLTNTMADAVFSLSLPDYRIEYVNRAVTEIFGYQRDELIGKTMHSLFGTSTDFDVFYQKQQAVLDAGLSQMRLENTMFKKDGKVVWIEMVTTFILANQQLSQMIIVMRDITQRSLLLGVVAHELRGPLSLLTGFSQTIIEEGLNNIDSESLGIYLNVINDNATRMLYMVDDLLDITKIELGDVSLQIETVSLNELIKIHINEYVHVAGKKNIELKIMIPNEVLICNCDPIKIGQVISNFIDNAIKYSNSGTIINVIGKNHTSMVWVGIRDEGPGIKSEEREHLFTGFGHTKISSKPTAGEKTTGLGLAICKKIIETHGGQIGVDTTLEHGSTFWFSLPLDGTLTDT